jgi:hypothetical protein
METMLVLNRTSEMAEDLAFPLVMTKKANEDIFLLLYRSNLIPNGIKKAYYKYYKVFKNDTTVKEVFTGDFKIFQPTLQKIKAAIGLNLGIYPVFSLLDDNLMFYGFLSQVKAMEFAKAGALKYISKLIDEGEKSYDLLIKYRETHYDDLNINLTDRNIKRIEKLKNS